MSEATKLRWCYLLAATLASVVSAGCSPSQYAKQADKSAYSTVSGGEKIAFGSADKFSVDYKPFAPEGNDPNNPIVVGGKVIRFGPYEPQKLSLPECLEIAVRNGRGFQTRKETLYSAALDLWSARRPWNWTNFGGAVTGEVSEVFTDKNTPQSVQFANAGVNLTLLQQFVDGGALTLGAGVNLATAMLGGDSTVVGSLLSANFTQPLLQGAWNGLAYEPQYRLERDFLFAVFDYARYTQTYSVGIATGYYAVLQQRDQLENYRSNIESLKRALAMTRVMVEGGQRSRVEQDQAEQALLSAQVSFESSQQTYRDALDNYKLLLGLPMQAAVELEYPAVLEGMKKQGPQPFEMGEDQALAVAFECRPDVLSKRAAVRDADRNVEIAINQFLPELDVALGINVPSTLPRDFYALRFDRTIRSADAKFNYQLDQTANRDSYRKSLIAQEKARRDLAEYLDTVRLLVRRDYRSLVQNRKTYDLQQRSLELAVRRRKLTAMELVGGTASARDVLDAEESLRQAQNGLTSALVTYTNTRLVFLASLGLIAVDEKGQIREQTQPQTFSRLVKAYPYVGKSVAGDYR